MDPKSGPQNTDTTLAHAFQYAVENEIGTVVVASTSGETGMLACKMKPHTLSQLVVVSHNTGFRSRGIQQMPPEHQSAIRSAGAILYTGTHVFRGIGSAIRNKMQYSEEELVADTLRIFGQGVKVCCEISAMAMDAGLIMGTEVVCVAGTARGADTALHITPVPSNNFFQTKVRRIICKPTTF